ncbi:MAG: hypothetical protein WAV93_13790 [Bacteroidales bacterium]
MRKSNIEIEATLGVILCTLMYFKDMPDDMAARKEFLKKYRNLKLRLKLLINDVYEYIIKNAGYDSGVSIGVQNQINNKAKPQRIWEHTIPWDVFFFYLVKKKFTSTADLYDYLKRTFCPCWITSDENRRLDAAGLKSKMPDDWERWDDRYKSTGVGINLSKQPRNPSNPSLNITKWNL